MTLLHKCGTNTHCGKRLLPQTVKCQLKSMPCDKEGRAAFNGLPGGVWACAWTCCRGRARRQSGIRPGRQLRQSRGAEACGYGVDLMQDLLSVVRLDAVTGPQAAPVVSVPHPV